MRKKIIIYPAALTIFFFLIFIIVNAQDAPPRGEQRNLRQNLFTLRALQMTRALDLSEQQTAVIFPELNRAEKDKAELQRQLLEEIRRLRQLMNSDKPAEEELENRVARIRELRQKIHEREEKFEEFLLSRLTPTQKARYIIFTLDFNRQLLERARSFGPGGQKNK